MGLLGLLTCLILVLESVDLLLQNLILLSEVPLLMEVFGPDGTLISLHALHLVLQVHNSLQSEFDLILEPSDFALEILHLLLQCLDFSFIAVTLARGLLVHLSLDH